VFGSLLTRPIFESLILRYQAYVVLTEIQQRLSAGNNKTGMG
jgi:hypothetical protein